MSILLTKSCELGVSGPTTALTSISDSDLSSIEFSPPSTVRHAPGPSKATIPEGKENRLTKKKSNSFSVLSSASTVRRSGSFKRLTSLASPSPPLHSVSLHGHGSGNSNARAMRRLGIPSPSVDGHGHAGSSEKKSARTQHYLTHSSTLSLSSVYHCLGSTDAWVNEVMYDTPLR